MAERTGMDAAMSVGPEGVPAYGGDDDGELARAFARSPWEGLLHLAGPALSAEVEPGLAFARLFARRYLSRACQLPGELAELPEVAPPGPEELTLLAAGAPPMLGVENLDGTALRRWWSGLHEAMRQRAAAAGGLGRALAELNPAWHGVGRVVLHLAENKRDPEYPFAFLATYTTSVSGSGKSQHVPLARALQEFSAARDRPALLKLLQPLHDASLASAWVKELVDSGGVYRTLPFTARQAHGFLSSVPALESAGVVVRVPDWWKPERPSRPVVSVRVGQAAATKVGMEALLDFSMETALDGVPLSKEEMRELMASTEPLVAIRGKWVELDRDKLAETLRHWQQVQARIGEGLTVAEALRLLSGVNVGAGHVKVPPPEVAKWTGLAPGEWLRRTLAGLREPTAVAGTVPAGLRAELRPYQRNGVHWLRFVTSLGLGACLADDMGLGKTVQMIGLLLHLHPVGCGRANAASLLVVPASLIPNWRSELARFAPTLRFRVAHPSETSTDDVTAAWIAETDLVITTYGMVARCEALSRAKWQVVVLDEAQAIKNPAAAQTRAVKALSARARVALTGTPVENRLGDLWSLFDFLNPGLLGTPREFGAFVKNDEGSDAVDRLAAVRSLVRPYILRRLKTDKSVISDLPGKIEMKTYCALTKTQAVAYAAAVEELRRKLGSLSGIERRGLVLAMLMRFKQICNHRAQAEGGEDWSAEHSGKFARLAEVCGELAARQQKALVFTQFREVTAALAGHLAAVFGRPGLVLHGQTPVRQRRELVERFQNDPNVPFFVLSLRAGGTGLNLTAASHVIHFDRWWNPAVENQATDRAFRIGQKNTVFVHKFITQGTVEERIDALIEEKKSMAEELFSTDGSLRTLTEMNDGELMRFVSLDVARAVGG
jgi:superfamily II DNA or RNA helicase